MAVLYSKCVLLTVSAALRVASYVQLTVSSRREFFNDVDNRAIENKKLSYHRFDCGVPILIHAPRKKVEQKRKKR